MIGKCTRFVVHYEHGARLEYGLPDYNLAIWELLNQARSQLLIVLLEIDPTLLKQLADDLDGGKGDLEVDIWYELDDEAQELLGVGEEVQFSVCRQDWHELVLNDLNGIGTFLPLIVFIQSVNKAFFEEAEVQTIRAPWISRFFLSIFDHIFHHLHRVTSLAHHLMMTVLWALRIIR
jgi:hypothetical protein